jgi:23S rRNA pseudouridine1911/1915/1917 synthase
MNTGPEWLRVDEAAAGQSIGAWLVQSHGSEAALLFARGGVWLNRHRIQNEQILLQSGDTVVVHRPPSGEQPDVVISEAMILYEDADLIVLNKSAGSYVEMTPWDAERHVRGALVHWMAARDGAVPTLHLAHRLDRDTSGVLLLTKNPQVNAALYASFGAGQVQKTYIALCAGDPVFTEQVIETGHGRSRNGMFRVYSLDEVGGLLPDGAKIKHMQTHLRVLQRFGDAALIEAYPKTGRTHQIRLHMAHIGHAVLGDAKYGGPLRWQGKTLTAHLLHAWRLVLPHPRTHFTLELEARLPEWVTMGQAPDS